MHTQSCFNASVTVQLISVQQSEDNPGFNPLKVVQRSKQEIQSVPAHVWNIRIMLLPAYLNKKL